jgi:cytochrome c551/c552
MSDHRPSRWLYLLTAAVLLVGTLMVIFGTRAGNDAEASEVPQSGCVDEVRQQPSGTSGLFERGAALEQLQCAGCHAGNRREIGPSYALIVERYRCRPGGLSAAIAHPHQGWADYPPGPAGPRLTRDDQAALVYWILNRGGSGDE